jgi:predicted transcriptional regulator
MILSGEPRESLSSITSWPFSRCDTMLNDAERKILRILWNQNQKSEAKLDMSEIVHRSQRSKKQVITALNTLTEKGYITYVQGVVKVINNVEQPKRKSPSSIDYTME